MTTTTTTETEEVFRAKLTQIAPSFIADLPVRASFSTDRSLFAIHIWRNLDDQMIIVVWDTQLDDWAFSAYRRSVRLTDPRAAISAWANGADGILSEAW